MSRSARPQGERPHRQFGALLNEVQLLRRQIGLERQHGRELVALGAALPREGASSSRMRSEIISEYTSRSYDDYIMYYLLREQARAAAHIQRMSAAGALTDLEREACESLGRVLGAAANAVANTPADALEASRAAAGGVPAARAALLCELIEAAERLEALAERRYAVEDWRHVARVDADSILEEHRLWAEVHRAWHAPGH